MTNSTAANRASQRTTIIHRVRRSPRLNPILQILPDGVDHFNYRGENYRRIYRLVRYRGRWYSVPTLQITSDNDDTESDDE